MVFLVTREELGQRRQTGGPCGRRSTAPGGAAQPAQASSRSSLARPPRRHG
jgi:hypothetical protein